MTTGQRPALLADDLRRHATKRPSDPAIVAGEETWSWADLDRRANGIAAAIAGLGLAEAPGQRVALAVGPTALGIAALHGVARAGAEALVVQPRLAAPEIAALLGRAACRSILIDAATGVAAPAGVSVVDLSVVADGTPPAGAPPATTTLGELILATSGTTARPKLARLPFDRLAASAAAWVGFLPPATGWLLSLGLAHVAGIGIVARAAAVGVPIVVPPSLEPAALLAAIETARSTGTAVSHLSLVATQLAGILDATGDARPPNGIAAVILGGGPIPAPLLHRAIAAGWPVIPSYGMTETASGVVALPMAEVSDTAEAVGRPLDGVELRLDDEAIQLRGPMVFAGYLDDTAATDATFTTDGWLHTGDLGRLDADGRLVVIGRSDDVIITGGEKVAPAEVEAALRSQPAIADVAVIGVPDPRWGSVPVAVVVLRPDAAATDDDLRAQATARLARYKVPARFVRVAALPRDGLGKVSRPDLRALALTPAKPQAAPDPIRRTVTTDDGQSLAIFELPDDATADADPAKPIAIVLHATLSTSEQLVRLARRLAERARVVLVDRRGSGESSMTQPGPVSVPRHVEDVIAVLDDLGIERAVLVGHSYGGVVALETAARHADRVLAVFVWEPPYLDVGAPAVRRAMRHVGDDVAQAFADGGAEGAAHRFLDTVAGAGAWDALRPRQQAWIGREGTGALADAAMTGLDPDGLARIQAPVVIASGDASEPFYAPIADALAGRIGPLATRVRMPDLRHPAPITDPAVIAKLAMPAFRPPPQETTP